MKIAHLTSAHPRFDTRIFYKMCSALVAKNHDVTLIVADGNGDAIVDEIQILDVGASRNRKGRIFTAPGRVFARAAALEADTYHLHDPELMPIGLKLKRLGKRVIFDAHEDFPRQLLSKQYLHKSLLHLLSVSAEVYEARACARFDGIIAATPFIRDKFLKANPNTVDINNFPILHEFAAGKPWQEKHSEICYVGGISKGRGIFEICNAMGKLKHEARLNLCGTFLDPEVEENVRTLEGWKRINATGFLDRKGVRDVLGRSMAGLVTLHPTINYMDALPVKMFEYMSAGIPVIASDFPLWRDIIEGNDCGLLVDPLDSNAIAAGIDKLVTQPDMAQRMGDNGRKAVEKYYNWQIEEEKLFAFYDSIGAH